MAFLAPLLGLGAIPFLLRKVSNDEELQKLNINTLKIQNNCGTVFTLAEKIEVQTQEDVTDYHAHKAQNGNILLCFVSPQLQMVVQGVMDKLSMDKSFKFKPLKKRLFLTLSDEQFQKLSADKKLRLKVAITGVFTQANDNKSLLEMELTSIEMV